MAGKVVNSSSVLLSKFVTGGKESASKTATSHILKTLGCIAPQNQESNAILRQKNNLKLYYENNLQKTKSKP